MQVISVMRRLLRDTRGATAVEYGLIVALLVIAIIVSMKGVANQNTGLWAVVTNHIDKVEGNAG